MKRINLIVLLLLIIGTTVTSLYANRTNGADLGIEITSDRQVVRSNDAVSYTIESSNIGPDAAEHVEIFIELPDGAVITSSLGQGWSCLTGEQRSESLTCELDLLNAGETSEFVIEFQAPEKGPDLLTSATINSDVADPDSTNNTATHYLALFNEQSDLSTGVILKQGIVIPGEAIRYAITIETAGPEMARNVQIDSPIPEGAELIGASGEGWTCALTTTDVPESDRVRENLICMRDALSVGEVSDVAIELRFPENEISESLMISARVFSDTYDSDEANNVSSQLLSVIRAGTDLLVEIESAPVVARSGGSMEFTILVRNDGIESADEILLLSSLSADATLSGFSGDGWTCTSSIAEGSTETECARASLAPTEESRLQLAFTIAESDLASELGHIVGVTSAALETARDNNLARVLVAVVSEIADLDVCISSLRTSALPERETSFSVNISNIGPDAAVGLRLSINLSSTDVEVLSALGDSWDCTGLSAEGQIECTRSGLGVDERSEIALTLLVTRAFADDVLSISTLLTQETQDPSSSNNSASAELFILRGGADLSISQTAESVEGGTIIRYQWDVLNIGPDDAENVRLINRLPLGTEILNLDQENWLCSTTEDQSVRIECALARLTAGEEATLSLELEVSEDESIENFVLVTSDSFDPDPQNNSIVARTPVP